MKASLLIIAALFLGAFGAHFLMEDRGYVLLRFMGYSVETSVPVLVLSLLLLYMLARLLVRVLKTPANIGRAAGAYRAKKARSALTRGLTQISAGNWAEAEKLLARQAHNSDAPALHYLNAARAAQLQGAPARRDNWLKLAHEQGDDDAPAVLLTEAELHLGDNNLDAALSALKRLEVIKPGHRQCLAMQAQVQEQREDWDALHALLPKLARSNALAPEALAALEQRVLGRLMNEAGNSNNAEGVRAHWRGLTRKQRKNIALQRAYISALASAGDEESAEKEIRTALKAEWDDALVLVYSQLRHEPAKTLKQIEKWLSQRGDDAILLLGAARQCMLNELWGKARSYLETSLSLNPRVDAYQLYGRLLNTMGETDAAVTAFRSGLSMATGDFASDLPALGAPRGEHDAEDQDELKADAEPAPDTQESPSEEAAPVSEQEAGRS